jgi:sec-independent protein translocase protein TatA
MMPNVGPLELGILILVALLVFGPKRLPELGKSAGRGIREFKASVGGGAKEMPELPKASPGEAAGETSRASAATDS